MNGDIEFPEKSNGTQHITRKEMDNLSQKVNDLSKENEELCKIIKNLCRFTGYAQCIANEKKLDDDWKRRMGKYSNDN